jgi:hypothetical protein
LLYITLIILLVNKPTSPNRSHWHFSLIIFFVLTNSSTIYSLFAGSVILTNDILLSQSKISNNIISQYKISNLNQTLFEQRFQMLFFNLVFKHTT